jgi:hypothetical protein
LERGILARGVEPSVNRTDPVGTPAASEAGAATAVNVTDRLSDEGFSEDVNWTVAVLRTVWMTVAETAGAKLLFPP